MEAVHPIHLKGTMIVPLIILHQGMKKDHHTIRRAGIMTGLLTILHQGMKRDQVILLLRGIMIPTGAMTVQVIHHLPAQMNLMIARAIHPAGATIPHVAHLLVTARHQEIIHPAVEAGLLPHLQEAAAQALREAADNESL